MKSIKFRKIEIPKKWLLRTRREFAKVHNKTMGGNFSISVRVIRKGKTKPKPWHFLVRTHSILHAKESGPRNLSLKWEIPALRLREIHSASYASARYSNTFSFERYL